MSDTVNAVVDFPDGGSKQRVAFDLLNAISKSVGKSVLHPNHEHTAEWILHTYAACYTVAIGNSAESAITKLPKG